MEKNVSQVPFLMSPRESEKLIEELRVWVGDHYGRKAEVARALGVSRVLIGDWLAKRSTPGFDNGLELRAFLRKEKRKRK